MARKRPAPSCPKAFVVQHVSNGVSVRAFTDRGAAEAHRLELERSVRAWDNPFRFGLPKGLASGGVRQLRTALKALGVRPPRRDEPWMCWWDAVYPETTPEQRDAIWDLLDNLHYFTVVEVPLED